MFKKISIIIGVIYLLVSICNAQVPQYINYQGLLADATGNPITGSYSISFRIYSASSGGSLLWGPQTSNINVDAGAFSVELGPISYSIFNGSERWLSIQVGNDAEMVPRKHLVSVGNSFRAYDADRVDGKDADSFADVNHTHPAIGDHLGNHTATENVKLNNHWLSNDGNSEGIFVNTSGGVTTSSWVVGNGGVWGYDPNDATRYGRVGGSSVGAIYGQYNNTNNPPSIWGYIATSSSGAYGSYSDDTGNAFGRLGASSKRGVYGQNGSGNGSDWGYIGGSGIGVYGEYNEGMTPNSWGFLGTSNSGVSGTYLDDTGSVFGLLGTSSKRGVYGQNGANWGFIGGPTYAGYFNGTGRFTGTLTKPAGSFEIDHPLDPANKYLYHSFVESPDMMNIYNGNAKLDANGEAWVELPMWFQALNKDYRYQLTPVGAPGPNLYIAEKISNNRFKIAGGTPESEVSWQVTGVRQDVYANKHRIQVEVEKTDAERGKYLHPEEHGMPITSGIGYDEGLAQQQKIEEMKESARTKADEQDRAPEENR